MDAHCHVYPAAIASRAVAGTDRFYDLHSVYDGTVEDLLEKGTAAGVDHFVVQSVATVPEQVGSINRFIAETVAAHPDSRGKGIGHAMLSYALEKLEARHCTYSILTTDDFRLSAIKTYLDAGFRPVLRDDPDSDQRARWDAVIATLGYPPVAYLNEV